MACVTAQAHSPSRPSHLNCNCSPVKDALAVETHVNVVRDACLRHAGRGSGEGQEGGGGDGDCGGDVQDHGLTVAQFQVACADLAKEEDFGEFKKLADNEGLSSAVYSRCVCVSIATPPYRQQDGQHEQTKDCK